MLLITLMLAIELLNRIENAPPIQTSQQAESIQQSITELKKEIEKLQQQLAAGNERFKDLPSLDADTLQQMTQTVEEDTSRLREDITQLNKELRNKQQQVAKAKQSEAKAKEQEEEELRDLQDQIAEAQKKLDEIEDNDRMFFTEGVAGKTTWIVEVVADGFSVAQIGVKAPPKRFSSTNDFNAWLKTLTFSSNAFYLVVKPGGVVMFQEIQRELSRLGFDLGIGLVATHQQVIDSQNGAGPP